MKQKVNKITETQLLVDFPIKSTVDGWYFRASETSNNCWKVEGQNQWGNKLSRTGNDPIVLQQELEKIAAQIEKEIK